ncbi:peroxiredoxin [Labrenzia sp. EL_13]|nr:peroxiredoxin [Labrenzia sp. EL_13]
MRTSFITFLILIGSFVAVANLYPILFTRELPVGKFARLDTPREVPDFEFSDAEGQTFKLADFRGQYLFVNVWATWCEPCREEMPALDQLTRDLSGQNIRILPISIDVTGAGTVERFYRRYELRDLPVYIDPSQAVMRSLNVFGIPTTVLIDPDGREIGRMPGPAQWDREESIQHLREIMN